MHNFDVTLTSEDGSLVAAFEICAASMEALIVRLQDAYPGAALFVKRRETPPGNAASAPDAALSQ